MTKEGLIEELHKSVRRNYPRRKVFLKGINDLWQADLIEMIPYAKVNKDYKYILIVINAFTKYVYAEPLKTKTGKDVTEAMSKILNSVEEKPKNLQTDQGSEFYNKQFQELMKCYGINLYSVYSTTKACIAERVIRTLKTKLWKTFSLQGTYRWIAILNSTVYEYNNTVHRTIGMKPSEVTKKNEQLLLNRINSVSRPSLIKSKFKQGDFVRISKIKSIFEKGYTPNWSAEVFRIKKVQSTFPTTYLLEDLNGTSIQGCFYPEEIKRTKFKDTYLVEKVVRKNKNKSYVKWWGFDSTHNSWINTNDIL